MKKMILLLASFISLSSLAGTTFFKERPLTLSDGTKGFFLSYDSKTEKCTESYWDGSKSDLVTEEISVRKCKDFVAAKKLVDEGGACKANEKLTDVKTILGITAKEFLKLDANCVCYVHGYVVGEPSEVKEFEKISKCEKAFGSLR